MKSSLVLASVIMIRAGLIGSAYAHKSQAVDNYKFEVDWNRASCGRKAKQRNRDGIKGHLLGYVGFAVLHPFSGRGIIWIEQKEKSYNGSYLQPRKPQ